MNSEELDIGQIKIHEHHRRLMPEAVTAIARSIAEIGLISPIAVRRVDGQLHLIAGRQRIEAHKELKKATIRAIVFDDDEITARIREFDENLCRASLSPAEEAEAEYERKQLWEALHPATKQGIAGGKASGRARGNRTNDKTSSVQTYTDEAAKSTGKTKRTVQRQVRRGAELGGEVLGKVKGTSLDKKDELDALVDIMAAEDDGPTIVAKLADEAASGKKVSAKTEQGKINRQRREREVAEKIGMMSENLQTAYYGIILTDPPWARETWSEAGKSRDPGNHYATQSEAYLTGLKLPAADDCILFMWSTQEHLDQAMRLIESWGFQYKSGAVWVKPKISTGYWFRTKHELLLVGTRGQPVAPAPGTQIESVFEAEAGRHSEKPTIIHEMIERLWPETPKLEMFARTARPGWDVWGAEAPEVAA